VQTYGYHSHAMDYSPPSSCSLKLELLDHYFFGLIRDGLHGTHNKECSGLDLMLWLGVRELNAAI